MPTSDIKLDLLEDEMNYTALMQDVSLSLLEYVNKECDRRNELRKFFMPPGVFDGIVNVFVQQLKKKPIRPHLCDPKARAALIEQFVGKIESSLTDREPRTFAEICEVLPCVTLQLNKANLSEPFAEL